jgi:hypothetical protein
MDLLDSHPLIIAVNPIPAVGSSRRLNPDRVKSIHNKQVMLAYLLLLTARQSDITGDLDTAVRTERIGTPGLKSAIYKTLSKFNVKQGNITFERTLGNTSGYMLTASADDGNENVSPTWFRIFVWSDGAQTRAQALKKIKFSDDQSFTQGEAYWRDDRLVIVGSQVNGGNGERAALSAYQFAEGKWKQIQHLEDNREGGAFFVRNNNAVDPTKIRVLTRDFTKYLEQPHVGPLPRYESRWTLKGGKYVVGPTTEMNTAISELERLMGFVTHHDMDSFERNVPSAYQKRLWNALGKYRAVQSITDTVRDDATVFRFGNDGPVMTMRLSRERWIPIKWADS